MRRSFLDAAALGERPFDVVLADLSFISLRVGKGPRQTRAAFKPRRGWRYSAALTALRLAQSSNPSGECLEKAVF